MAVVCLGPAAGHQHVVGAQVGPVVEPGVLPVGAERGHGGQQKGEPGAGRRRILDHQQAAVGGVDQVDQRRRRRQSGAAK